MTFQPNPLAQALAATLVLSLAACGGGGGSDTTVETASNVAPAPVAPAVPPGVAPAPTLVTLNGTVVGDLAIRNALVCMDLNANGACDADEPASARTGADGAYSITYDPAKVTAAQVAATSLIAPMVPGAVTDPATTIDGADPGEGNTAKPYVLRQVPGKAGQINPLTTLVARAMADGMTEAAARTNAALQLRIDAARIDDYQGDPATGPQVQDNARWIAQVAAAALEAGLPLRVADQTAAATATDGDLSLLRYVDSGNYLARTYPVQAKAQGTPGGQVLDARIGRTNGSVTDPAALYNFAYLSPRGWIRCDAPWPSSSGTPNRSTYCEASESAGFSTSTDIAGKTMASVVTDMQADPASNVINNGVPAQQLLADLGNAVFPAGSRINRRTTLTLASSIFINSLSADGRPQLEAQTLEQLIAAKPASAVLLPGPGGSLTLGLGSGNFRNLRVAFTGITDPTSGTVQFYECDLDSTQSIATNCAKTVAGTYSIATVNGARVMRFAGAPANVMNNNRVYVEVRNAPAVANGNWVYQARENKTDREFALSVQQRLNSVAWLAMKATLGL